jgi:Ca-activated chloride channel family protein
VGACRKAGILINTFMLARDPALVAFVNQVSQIARGKAYFTSTMTLGQYIMRDFLRRKTKRAG